jgi:hypothetical protein
MKLPIELADNVLEFLSFEVILQISPVKAQVKFNNNKHGWHTISHTPSKLVIPKLKFLITNKVKGYTRKTIDYLVIKNELEAIKLMHEKYEFNENILDLAAERGHLDMVKYLFENKYKCSTAAIDNASYNGHFKVVEYLVERNQKYTNDAIDGAMIKNRVEIVEYLSKRENKCTKWAVEYARVQYDC